MYIMLANKSISIGDNEIIYLELVKNIKQSYAFNYIVSFSFRKVLRMEDITYIPFELDRILLSFLNWITI
jgi:hypothetical protein